MSHFTVLVEVPLDSSLEQMMIPFFEQGEKGDFFMVFGPETVSLRDEYKNKTVQKIVMPDGSFKNKWDDEFRVKGTIGIGGNSHKVPEDLERRDILFQDLYDTFEEFLEDWHGMTKEHHFYDGEWGYWSNPNAKWDWYTPGGRWSQLLRLKPDWVDLKQENDVILGLSDPRTMSDNMILSQKIAANWGFENRYESAMKKIKEENMTFGSDEEKHEFLFEQIGIDILYPRADGAPKRLIDFEAMEKSRIEGRVQDFWQKKAWIENGGFTLEETILVLKQMDEIPREDFPKRDERKEHPVVSKFDAIFNRDRITEDEENPYGFMAERSIALTLTEWMAGYNRGPSLTFAFLTAEGEWFEPGYMGMFAMTNATEETRKEYSQDFWDWIDNVPDDHQLIVVDCHI
jgi:hypothetical protein